MVALFSTGAVGMTPAGGFWVQGLNEAGVGNDEYDVTYFPKMRGQRHQFGAGGYAIMDTSERKEEAWQWLKYCVSVEGMSIAHNKPDSSIPRKSLNDKVYGGDVGPQALAGLLRHSGEVPRHRRNCQDLWMGVSYAACWLPPC